MPVRWLPVKPRVVVGVLGLLIAACGPGQSSSGATDTVVVTTMPIPSQLEPGGVELQDEILADGNVSREEFTRTIAGMAECMTAHGVTGVTWSLIDELYPGGRIGSWSMGYDEPSADLNKTTESLCYYSYVDRVANALVDSQRRDSSDGIMIGSLIGSGVPALLGGAIGPLG